MIWFDTTKSGRAAHQSGLVRVGRRLLQELGGAASAVSWPFPRMPDEGCFFTSELFSAAERPGFSEFLRTTQCRTAALFHDAIPLKHPQITWPQSVARHAAYVKMLASFHRVFAVSRASRDELVGFWRWQGLTTVPPVEVLPLGADFNGCARQAARPPDAGARPLLLCVGILEPRKNQAFLVDVCEELWGEGIEFELHLVGRVNPHFGKPVQRRVFAAHRKFRDRIVLHEGADDASLRQLYTRARATVFPTIAEGCGLPLLESLWMGVPCVCSDLAVLRENADGGGCLPVATSDRSAWAAALRKIVTDGSLAGRLTDEATSRELPTWAESAKILKATLA